MLGLALETSWFLGTNHEWVKNAKLACNYLGKAKFCSEYGSMDILYSLSHFVPLSPTFYPTQGYPSKFLALLFMYEYSSDFRKGSIKVLCICTSLHAPNFTFKSLLCVISPQHQPFINPNYSKNTKLAMT